MVSKNVGRRFDAGQQHSYNEGYSTLKTECTGWSSRRMFCVRDAGCGSAFPRNREWTLGAMPSMVYKKDPRRNSRTTSKEFSNS
jgi:hypothetical protein